MEDIAFIQTNEDGNYYVGYRVKVQRGIRGKNKSKVDELIIVGMHKDDFPAFCKKHHIIIKEGIMKDDDIEPYLGREVKVYFKDGDFRCGVLEKGYHKIGDKWVGAGYHLLRGDNDISFRKSHIKRILYLKS